MSKPMSLPNVSRIPRATRKASILCFLNAGMSKAEIRALFQAEANAHHITTRGPSSC